GTTPPAGPEGGPHAVVGADKPSGVAAPPAAVAKPADDTPGPGSAAKPGYLEAYRAGHAAYKEGLIHFREARPGSGKNRYDELKAAQKKFGEAGDQFGKARELRERDPKLDEMMTDINQYQIEIR